jgi:alpha-L-fucosidase
VKLSLPPLFKSFPALAVAATFFASAAQAYTLPELPPVPALPAPHAAGSVAMGNAAAFSEVKMDFAIETNGPFQPTWSSISQNVSGNGTPAWLRQAKFGIWFHYGPQASLSSGDWSAQHMYQQGSSAYNNHLANFGHPTTNGYKEVINAWNPDRYNPAGLAQLFYNAGARFVLVQGVHHDNFDNWDSRYNPWNMMNFGARRDTMAEWTNALHSLGMRMGVAFHHEYSWWFYQPAFLSDSSGTFAGVPYDAVTATNGTGKWWQNCDPRFLYTPADLHEYSGIATPTTGYWNPGSGIFVNHLDYANWFATWWALRMLDVVEKYNPDFIYTDGTSTQPFSGFGTGTGYKCDAMQRVIAHFYNRALQRRGELDTLAVVKFHNGDRIATTFEGGYSSTIKTDQPWFAEFGIGDWFYRSGISYDNGGAIVQRLLEAVSRDGAMMVNIPNRPDGSFDSGVTNMLNGVGKWMTNNSEGIYGSQAWLKPTEGSFRFTRGSNGWLYAYYMGVPSAGTKLTIASLATASNLLAAPITSVSMLGSAAALSWSQTSTGLVVTCPTPMPGIPSGTAVGFKIGPASAIGITSPTSFLAAPQTNHVALSWDYASSSARFAVKRSTTAGGPYTSIATNLSTLSCSDTNATANTIYYYVVSATDNGLESVNSAESSASLSGVPGSTWLSQDIGAVGASGSVSQATGVFTVNGSGADIWYSADEFRYVFQAVRGDYMFTARVLNIQNTANWAKAGIMMRETLNADSRYVVNFMSPANGVALQQRTGTGASSAGVAGTSGVAAPYWVRLVRGGNAFTGYSSTDGTNWTALGTTTVSMMDDIYLGLAVCSVNDGTLCQAQFDNVSISTPPIALPPETPTAAAGDTMIGLTWPAAENATTYNVKRATASGGPYAAIASVTATSYLNTGLTNGTTYYYVVSSANVLGETDNSAEAGATPGALMLSGPWNQADVGAVGAAGTGGNANSSFFIQGSGADVWYAADELHVVYINLTNDCSITARVPYVQNVQNTSKAGVMIRETLATDSMHAFVDVTPTTTLGVEFIRRTSTGGSTTADGSAGVTAPQWVRLTRVGDSFIAYRSADGVSWIQIGSPVTISMTPNVRVGLAVNSHLDGTLCQAWFDNVSWTPAIAPPGVPGWISATIGDAQATLTWASSVNATGYNLKRSASSGGPYAIVAANTAYTSFTNTGLANGSVYYYVVSATNHAGESANSMQIVVQPVSMVPLTFSYGIAGNQLQLSWPITHKGWRLEVQTNLVAGLGTNWFSIPGSSGTNQMFFPLSPTNPSVFFRLAYP